MKKEMVGFCFIKDVIILTLFLLIHGNGMVPIQILNLKFQQFIILIIFIIFILMEVLLKLFHFKNRM